MASRNSNVLKLLAFALGFFVLIMFGVFFPGTSEEHHVPTPERPQPPKPPKGGVNVNVPKATVTPIPNDADPNAQFYAVSAPDVKKGCPNLQFAWNDIKSHNKHDDLWVVVRGMVLNVTDFLPSHPGGPAIMQGAEGTDAESLFTQFHQPTTVALFAKFCIGTVLKN